MAGVDVTKIKESTFMIDGQMDAVTWRYVTNIEVSPPVTLAIDACCYLAIGCGADGADEWGNWPLDGFTEM